MQTYSQELEFLQINFHKHISPDIHILGMETTACSWSGQTTQDKDQSSRVDDHANCCKIESQTSSRESKSVEAVKFQNILKSHKFKTTPKMRPRPYNITSADNETYAVKMRSLVVRNLIRPAT